MNKLLTLLALCALMSTQAFAQLPAYVPSNGLIAWLPLDGNLNDLSGNNNNATGTGYTSTTDRNGNTNKACNFPGPYSYAQLNNLSLNTGSSYTQNFWLKINSFVSFPGQSYIILDIHPWTSCSTYPQFDMYGDSIVLTECGIWGPSKAWGYKSAFTGNWKMVTQVVNGDTTVLYLDGALVKKYYYTWGSSSDVNITIANCNTFGNNYNLGGNQAFDDFGVWNRALTECEIKKLYYGISNYIVTQPANQYIINGNTASFTVTSGISSGGYYQWQVNNGSGFTNLSNGGQYSGVNTNTLTISGVNNNNQNQTYRCIVGATTACADTSNSAKLTTNVGINNIAATTGHVLYQNLPNPFHGETEIGYFIASMKQQADILIYDIQGRKIFAQMIVHPGTGSIKINDLNAGVYFYSLSVDGTRVGVKKMVVE